MAILKHKNRGAKNDRQQNCRRKWLQLDKYKRRYWWTDELPAEGEKSRSLSANFVSPFLSKWMPGQSSSSLSVCDQLIVTNHTHTRWPLCVFVQRFLGADCSAQFWKEFCLPSRFLTAVVVAAEVYCPLSRFCPTRWRKDNYKLSSVFLCSFILIFCSIERQRCKRLVFL